MEETNFVTTWLMSQSWYATAFQIMGAATALTMWISDKWADKYPVIKQVNIVMNWISGNIFRNKNKGEK